MTSTLWRQAVGARQEAVFEAQRAEASKLLALAQLRLEEDPTEALAYTTLSLELADSKEARVFVMKVLWAAPPALELIAPDCRFPVFSPDGKRLATLGFSEFVHVWSEDAEGPLVLGGHEVSDLNSHDGGWTADGLLVTGNMTNDAPGSVHVWSFPEGERLRTFDFARPTVWEVGTRHLLARTREEAPTARRDVWLLRRWLLPDGEPENLGRVDRTALGTSRGRGFSRSGLDPNGQGLLYTKGRSVYFRPLPAADGSQDRLLGRHDTDVAALFRDLRIRRLVSADGSGEIRLWSFPPQGPELHKVIPRPETAPKRLSPDAEGRWVTSQGDRQVRLWDTSAWRAARPLALRRSGSWMAAIPSFHPRGDWIVASTQEISRLTFWPLRKTYSVVVDGYSGVHRPLAFSPDGRWLATSWATDTLRLWPLPGSGNHEVRPLGLAEEGGASDWYALVYDPQGRYLFVVGDRNRAYIVPLDGSPPRKLPGARVGPRLHGAAVSPSGRLVATAFSTGRTEKTLRVWDVETGELRLFHLPEPASAPPSGAGTGGVADLHFADESTLYTAGHGGIRRWDLRNGAHELVVAKGANVRMAMAIIADGPIALTHDSLLRDAGACRPAELHDLTSGESRALPAFGECVSSYAVAGSGGVTVTGDREGIVRVGKISEEEPHLLMGHEGPVHQVAISQDLRWPMPDLSQPPLHTLPHAELLAKLRSLTNLRVIRDPGSPNGYRIDLGPFPGWQVVPTW